jgi:hypothetical protein
MFPTCPTCFGRLTSSCTICRGAPDATVSIDQIARGVHRVDVATGGTIGGYDLLDLLRRP